MSGRPPYRLSVVFGVHATSRTVETLLEREFERTGVDLDTYALLALISQLEPVTPTVLMTEIGYTQPTLWDKLRKLEERGHISREPNPNDARSYLVSLTTAGRRAQRAGQPAILRTMRALEEHLELPLDDVERALYELQTAALAALSERESSSSRRARS